MPHLALAIITHTPRHLRRTLLAASAQARTPDRIVVSCDADHNDLLPTAAHAASDFNLHLDLLTRPHTGQSRSAQARNNAVRHLLDTGLPHDANLVFLDGDCAPAFACLQTHERLLAHAHLAVGFRIDLTPEQTDAFDEHAVLAGQPPAHITPQQWATLRARHRRYQLAALARRLGLAKPHKPKVLSANVAIRLQTFTSINGFDEQYTNWGQEDDDLGRRAYAAGARPAVAVASAVVFHQYHTTRAAQRWHDSPGVARFNSTTPTRCTRGLSNPLEQPPIAIARLTPRSTPATHP
ncbi:MAG: glycosyltransferase [Phycisphaeraceae bacterium]|nr:MAG: glycosyltransferase [Phycisphaeraceae bacterium]